MNPAAISAMAAIGGSSLGALGPVLSSYVLQRSATRKDLIAREVAERQKLYSEFITQATRFYAEAMTRNDFELNEMVELYAIVARIRLMASGQVVQEAEAVVKTIIQRFGEANVSLASLRSAALQSHADPLFRFSSSCRLDLQHLTNLRS